MMERQDEERARALQPLICEWNAARLANTPATLLMLVSGSGAEVDLVNRLAQAERIAAGELGEASVAAIDRDYRLHVGDVVIQSEVSFRFQYDTATEELARPVPLGQVGIIKGIDVDRDCVHLWIEEPGEQPQLVEIDHASLRKRQRLGLGPLPSLRLAYAASSLGGPDAVKLRSDALAWLASLPGHRRRNDPEETHLGGTRASHLGPIHVSREDVDAPTDVAAAWAAMAREHSFGPEQAAALLSKPASKVAADYREEGWTVLAVALDGWAAQLLGRDTQAPAFTLAQLMHHLDNGWLTLEDHTVLLADSTALTFERWCNLWDKLAALQREHGPKVVFPGRAGGAIQ